MLPSVPAMLFNRPTVAYPRVENVSEQYDTYIIPGIVQSILNLVYQFVKELQNKKKYGKLGAVGYILCFCYA